MIYVQLMLIWDKSLVSQVQKQFHRLNVTELVRGNFPEVLSSTSELCMCVYFQHHFKVLHLKRVHFHLSDAHFQPAAGRPKRIQSAIVLKAHKLNKCL